MLRYFNNGMISEIGFRFFYWLFCNAMDRLLRKVNTDCEWLLFGYDADLLLLLLVFDVIYKNINIYHSYFIHNLCFENINVFRIFNNRKLDKMYCIKWI